MQLNPPPLLSAIVPTFRTRRREVFRFSDIKAPGKRHNFTKLLTQRTHSLSKNAAALAKIIFVALRASQRGCQ